MRPLGRRQLAWIAAAFILGACTHPAQAQGSCEIPAEAAGLWRCENGFVIGPEDVIVRLPIPEENAEQLYRAGLEAAGREDWRIAIAYFSAAHHRAHLVPRYMYNLGLAYARAGKPVLAVAWLTAYLVAAPDAPNRETVWRQIRSLEGAGRREANDLWSTAEQATALVPRVGPNGGARREALIALTVIAGAAGDLARGRRYFRNALAASTTDPGSDEGIDAFLRQSFVRALIVDRNLAEAEPLAGYLDNSPNGEAYRRTLANMRLGRTRRDLEPWAVTAPFLGGPDCDCPILKAAWTQDAAELARLAEARRADSDAATRLTALAALGDTRAAIDGLLAIDAFDREMPASNVAEILYLRGDFQETIRARGIAIQSVPSDRSGIWAARANALDDAASGQIDAAITRLLVVLSRQGRTSRPLMGPPVPPSLMSWTPARQWVAARFDPAGLIAEYLVRTGAGQSAVRAEERLDTFRRIRLYETAYLAPHFRRAGRDPEASRRAALELASGGDPALIERRAAIEGALIVAYGLPGSIYDQARWLAYAQAAERTTEQIIGLGRAAHEILRSFRTIRAEFERSGGTWRGLD